MITSYTFPYTKIVNRIVINFKVGNPGEDITASPEYKALWDTGATITCISQELATKLALMKVDETLINGANNVPFKADVFCVKLLMGKFEIPIHRVAALPMDNTGHDLIIGMDIITQGDLSITNYEGKTVITFRTPSLEKIDYTDEINKFKSILNEHNIRVRKGIPDKCGCKSGKDYKNCHGKSVYAKNLGK